MPNMKRWSEGKLDRELVFAEAFLDVNDPNSVAWLEACRAERERRRR